MWSASHFFFFVSHSWSWEWISILLASGDGDFSFPVCLDQHGKYFFWFFFPEKFIILYIYHWETLLCFFKLLLLLLKKMKKKGYSKLWNEKEWGYVILVGSCHFCWCKCYVLENSVMEETVTSIYLFFGMFSWFFKWKGFFLFFILFLCICFSSGLTKYAITFFWHQRNPERDCNSLRYTPRSGWDLLSKFHDGGGWNRIAHLYNQFLGVLPWPKCREMTNFPTIQVCLSCRDNELDSNLKIKLKTFWSNTLCAFPWIG